MIRVRTLGEHDLPWCEWTHFTSKDIIDIDRPFSILIGEECRPIKHEEPNIILYDKNQATEENPYSGDFCYISVSDDPTILSGEVDGESFNLIKKWIVNHKETILNVWNGKYGTYELCKEIGYYDKIDRNP